MSIADESGRRLVGRNGYHQQWDVLTATGAGVTAPRVNDKRVNPNTGEAATGSPRQLVFLGDPHPWARKSPAE